MQSPTSANPFAADRAKVQFFVGRESQLATLNGHLRSLVSGVPSNLAVVGRGGEGKTAFLYKAAEVARGLGIVACVCDLDINKPAEVHARTILKGLLKEVEVETDSYTLLKDFARGKESTFQTPHSEEIITDDLATDFCSIRDHLAQKGKKAILLLIDEGQRISPTLLSALKNSLQQHDMNYMVVISLLNSSEEDNAKAGGRILDKLANLVGDPGASRFFPHSIPLGPFESEKTAKDCIKKRLENNTVTFDEEATNTIVEIEGKRPKEMIDFAYDVYNEADGSSIKTADKPLVDQTFNKTERGQKSVRKVREFRGMRSNSDFDILRKLAQVGVPVSPPEFVRAAYPTVTTTDAQAALVQSIEPRLDDFHKTGTCGKNGAKYFISDPEIAYVLKSGVALA